MIYLLLFSVWLQPEVGFGGMLVAKATSDGFTRFYALELVADGGSYIVRFSFLPDTEQVEREADYVCCNHQLFILSL